MNRSCKSTFAALFLMLAAGLAVNCPPSAFGGEPVTSIRRINHTPVDELVRTLEPILRGLRDDDESQALILVPDRIGNNLLLRGDALAVKQITAMIEELDRKPRTVLVEVVIASATCEKKPGRIAIRGDGTTTAEEMLEALGQQGEMQVLARAQLSAINIQPAYIQVGRQEPRVTGVMQSARGQARQVQMEDVGFTFGLTPRIHPDGTVSMEADVEQSGFGPAESSVELDADGAQAASVETLSVQTTVCAKSGQTVVLGGLTEQNGKRWTKLIALLTPHVLPDH
jgi:type II secretory pathway component GspD/PulD (secretin)